MRHEPISSPSILQRRLLDTETPWGHRKVAIMDQHSKLVLTVTATTILILSLLGGCSTSSDPSGVLQTGETVTAEQGTGPVGQAMPGAVPQLPQTPPGITTISVPAFVSEGEVQVVPPSRPHPEVVLTEIPKPARIGPRPAQQRLDITGLDAKPPGPQRPAGSKALKTSFASTTFIDNSANTGGYVFIPPDPSAAAGLDHLVNVVNVTIRFHQKDGTQDFNSSLANFFASESPRTNTFDPKVIYDQYQDRFVVVTLEYTDTANGDPPPNSSRIMLAVSDDGDPNGTWYTTSWSSDISNTWADYPGYSIDQAAIYICVNQFGYGGGGFAGTRQWVIGKGAGSGGFYDGGAASPVVYDLSTATGVLAATTQPAHIFGSSPFVSGAGTFFVIYSGLSGGGNEYIGVMSLEDPFGTPTAGGQYVILGDIETFATGMPNAPQLGSATLIETNDRRSLHSVWRVDSLWLTTTIVPASGEATAYWIEIDTSPGIGSMVTADQGAIDGEDIATGTYTFFPSIGVNSTGDVGIGYSASASTIYAGAYYTTRKIDDAAGTTQGSQVLAAGTDYYRRTFGGPQNRWGDYTGLAVDPVDQCFWSYNEYAMARGNGTPPEDGQWATVYGLFCPST
jgi:hypothetical protein